MFWKPREGTQQKGVIAGKRPAGVVVNAETTLEQENKSREGLGVGTETAGFLVFVWILCFLIMAHPKLMKQKILSSLEARVNFKGHFP